MAAYRAGYNVMWKYAGDYMRRKGFKRPGQFRRDNQHGGRLWASRKECTMTNNAAGEILERVYESGAVSWRQLAQVRHSLSYSYYLRTANGGSNWPEVRAQWRSFSLAKLPKTRSLMPTRIPTPQNLKEAFTKPWSKDHPLSLANFMTGVLASYDFHVFGLRPNVDTKKVKDSFTHDINGNEGYGRTAMVEGRSKLHLTKRGTRPWQVYRVCTCKGPHIPPTPRQLRVGKDGNPKTVPKWNTVCPLNAMLFVEQHHKTLDWKAYTKWTKKGMYEKQNHGDIPTIANTWLQHQTGQEAFDHHCGRKSLARWLGYLKIPYGQGLPIHGDLEQVWRSNYQDKLDRSNYRVRDQPTDPDVCCKALRRLVKWFHKAGEPTLSIRARLQNLLDQLGEDD